MKKDSELYQRAAKMARSLVGTEQHGAQKVIRALLSACNQKDRELAEWRSGRMAKAHEKERDSLIAANRYLREMIERQSKRGAA